MRWFSDKELEEIDNFITKHVTDLDCYRTNNSNHNNLGFTITHDWSGIGINTNITCNCCKETKDVTDYSVW